jgi:peptidoglycan/xylan/chitin deacetylase (PgdA/CDA1 family)
VILAPAAGALTGAAGLMAWAVRGRSSTVFAPSVWHGPRDKSGIAITFDDGPSEGTGQILDILERHNVPATFFQVGMNVERLPAVARAVRDAGHEIGNHSYSHPLLSLKTPGVIGSELRRAHQAIEKHTGVVPMWFRAPYGVRWFGLRRAQQSVGVTGVMWTTIGYDWKRNPEWIVSEVVKSTSNGAILCLHDGRELRVKPDIGATVEAVRRLVPMLLDRGYHFETVSRLLCPTKSHSGS